MTGVRTASRLTPFQDFFKTEAAGGALLVVCAAAALILANSPWAEAYHRLWSTPVSVAEGEHTLSLTLHQWINDGLMAVFFLFVGLEIKREALAGELASPRQAALPIAAAIGGMVAPAIIYRLVSGGGVAAHGWAIPMATDIAFALGVLAIVAPDAPLGLKVFLAALAIVDDLGAVLVIAVFYTGQIAVHAMGLAGLTLLLLVALNLLGVRQLWPYLLLGVVLWYFVHESGVHATVAGVLLAAAIPTRTSIDADEFAAAAHRLLEQFERTETGDRLTLTSKGQRDALHELERASQNVTAPLVRLEHELHRVTAFLIMPLFAFSNAGVTLQGTRIDRVTLAIAVGLLAGKSLGITGASMAVVRSGLASLPTGVTWKALHACAWLAGIGFTMSLFIAILSFEGTPLIDGAKVGILGGSLLAGIIGAILLRHALSTRAA